MIPKYTGTWDRGSMWRGDTLLGFTMRIVEGLEQARLWVAE